MIEPFTSASLSQGPSALRANQTYLLQGRLLIGIDPPQLKLDDREGESVLIHDADFVERLRGIVPGYVGGRNLYNDMVRLQASLKAIDGRIVIARVISGNMYREDEGEYRF